LNTLESAVLLRKNEINLSNRLTQPISHTHHHYPSWFALEAISSSLGRSFSIRRVGIRMPDFRSMDSSG
jgi:hypothetical protein